LKDIDNSTWFLLYFVFGVVVVNVLTQLIYYTLLRDTTISIGISIIVAGVIISLFLKRQETNTNNIKNQKNL